MVIPVLPATPTGRPSTWHTAYARLWVAAALVAVGVFVSIAVLQTPTRPLSLFALSLALIGGTLFVQAPWRSARGRTEYVNSALAVAALSIALVGVGHHLTAGLTVFGLLGALSPEMILQLRGH